MAATSSIDWRCRMKNVHDLYMRHAISECVEELHDLLREPHLPCLYSVKCHIMLGMASSDLADKTRHSDTAAQLWSVFASSWTENSSTEVCEVEQLRADLIADISRHDSPSRRGGVAVNKRLRSQSLSPGGMRRIKRETPPSSMDLIEDTEHTHLFNIHEDDYGDNTIRPSIEQDSELLSSLRSPGPNIEEDVKYDTAYLDKQHELQTLPHELDSLVQYSSARLPVPGAPRIARLRSPETPPYSLF